MSKEKSSFIIHLDYEPLLEDLSLEDKGILLDAMFAYAKGESVPELKPLTKMAFNFIQRQMDYDKVKWLKKCEKNKENINKRWQDKDTPDDTTVYDRIPKIPTNTKHTDKDKDKENGKEKDKKPPSQDTPALSARFNKPTIKDIASYITELGYNFKAEAFYDFYESKGWLIGKTPMKCWKSACRTWGRNSGGGNKIDIGGLIDVE